MARRFLIAVSIALFGVRLAVAQQESNSNRPQDYYEVTYYWAYREGGSGPDGTDPTKLSVPDPDEGKAKVALQSWQKANPSTLLLSGIGQKTVRVPVNRFGTNRNPQPTDPLKGSSAQLTPGNANQQQLNSPYQQSPYNSKSETEVNYEKAAEESRKEIEETFNRLRRIPLIDEWDQIANEIERVEKKAIDEGNPIINEFDPRIKALRDKIVDFGRKRDRDKKEAEDVLSLARKLALGRDRFGDNSEPKWADVVPNDVANSNPTLMGGILQVEADGESVSEDTTEYTVICINNGKQMFRTTITGKEAALNYAEGVWKNISDFPNSSVTVEGIKTFK